MEQISIIPLTVPIFFPLAESPGFDQIWFAVIMQFALEISLTTPPFGLLLFVMKGVALSGITMLQIYTAAFPFVLGSLLVVALIVVWPPLVLWPTGRWGGALRRLVGQRQEEEDRAARDRLPVK